ncbi:hypothetical protein [Salidesulfovibrio brasiliensis]|uniref:hypothetical protein n=1 Tax=Salidesulfovibrio brasiliensis TaxID=221711 RepID=UPI0006D0896A|nr:hypothetical protein [Salidesulfovibrio brasiliensis]
MTPAESAQEVRELLVRIDERVRAVQEDIREINDTRRCHSHRERIRTLERMLWGCMACVTGLGVRLLYDVFR